MDDLLLLEQTCGLELKKLLFMNPINDKQILRSSHIRKKKWWNLNGCFKIGIYGMYNTAKWFCGFVTRL